MHVIEPAQTKLAAPIVFTPNKDEALASTLIIDNSMRTLSGSLTLPLG